MIKATSREQLIAIIQADLNTVEIIGFQMVEEGDGCSLIGIGTYRESDDFWECCIDQFPSRDQAEACLPFLVKGDWI